MIQTCRLELAYNVFSATRPDRISPLLRQLRRGHLQREHGLRVPEQQQCWWDTEQQQCWWDTEQQLQLQLR